MTAGRSEQAIHLEGGFGHYSSGVFAGGAAEIVAFDADSERLFVINTNDVVAERARLAIRPTPRCSTASICQEFSGGVNSVAVHDGLKWLAAQNEEKTEPGLAVFMDIDGDLLKAVTVGACPTW
ncbi:MAG: hypothetical protein R3D55_28135 [Chloroflexota bacterium]